MASREEAILEVMQKSRPGLEVELLEVHESNAHACKVIGDKVENAKRSDSKVGRQK